MATGQKYEQLEQHPLFKSYFQDDASSPCAGLAVFGCLDLPAWPFHTLSSSVRPGAFHSTLHWESPVIWLHIFAQGYTSLGNPENTIRNPALAYTDPLGETRWVPVDQEKIFTFWIKSSCPGSTQPTCWRTLLWKGKAGSETWTKSSEMFDNIPTNSLPPSLVLAKAL